MNRIRDYGAFAIWFVGLSYIVMWPLTTPDIQLSAGAVACRSMMLRGYCELANPALLPPALHVAGLLAAVFVIVRLLLIALRAARKPPASENPRRGRRFRAPPPTAARIKQRDHFGLRGMPR